MGLCEKALRSGPYGGSRQESILVDQGRGLREQVLLGPVVQNLGRTSRTEAAAAGPVDNRSDDLHNVSSSATSAMSGRAVVFAVLRLITSSYFVCACTGRSLDLLLPCASPLLCFVSLATAAQLRNRRVKQNKVSPRLARVKPDDRTTQRGECETFRLAIEIAEPPCFEEPSSPPPAESSSSRAIVEDLSLR